MPTLAVHASQAAATAPHVLHEHARTASVLLDGRIEEVVPQLDVLLGAAAVQLDAVEAKGQRRVHVALEALRRVAVVVAAAVVAAHRRKRKWGC